MASSKFKVESGLQLLARLRKKPENGNFYPPLFDSGLKIGEVVELYSDQSMSCLLADIISEALMPENHNGVLLLNTDGNMCFDVLVNSVKHKFTKQAQTPENMNVLLQNSMRNLHILEIYDSMQFYTTIHNLESILMENPNISVVVIDTLTAFYWSEQGFKVIKMDVYLKNLLKIIQKVTKEFNIKIIYTRPQYFSSSKDCIENLEACSKDPTLECINYRMQVVLREDGNYQVTSRTSNNIYSKLFCISGDTINWL